MSATKVYKEISNKVNKTYMECLYNIQEMHYILVAKKDGIFTFQKICHIVVMVKILVVNRYS
ncbi:hypothetical protein NLO413_0985 [Candidatus Neoehrlichia lotoris str. RAC413]|uniref:Uncharacterized protein n=1 Tax=Candidatus Neoehrlichia procyonis str. RAC413 TaxID=1359163 RepID=A0A0F3NNH0_9RICK|nr:hypothetical protein NLO413_0985 [Candidatus Neoehrlichia lotoris str. RAC413]